MAKAKQTGEVFEITDMSAPILTEMQKAALAGASQANFDFSSDTILEAAK